MDLLKVLRFSCHKRLHNKGDLNSARNTLNCFSPSVLNMVCATRSKINKHEI